MSTSESVIADVLKERRRQVSVEGYSPEHDDEHGCGDLAVAAACYAAPGPIYLILVSDMVITASDPWPWSTGFHRGDPINLGTKAMKQDKPRRRQLVIAAALLVAEIERLDRAEEAEHP